MKKKSKLDKTSFGITSTNFFYLPSARYFKHNVGYPDIVLLHRATGFFTPSVERFSNALIDLKSRMYTNNTIWQVDDGLISEAV